MFSEQTSQIEGAPLDDQAHFSFLDYHHPCLTLICLLDSDTRVVINVELFPLLYAALACCHVPKWHRQAA